MPPEATLQVLRVARALREGAPKVTVTPLLVGRIPLRETVGALGVRRIRLPQDIHVQTAIPLAVPEIPLVPVLPGGPRDAAEEALAAPLENRATLVTGVERVITGMASRVPRIPLATHLGETRGEARSPPILVAETLRLPTSDVRVVALLEVGPTASEAPAVAVMRGAPTLLGNETHWILC